MKEDAHPTVSERYRHVVRWIVRHDMISSANIDRVGEREVGRVALSPLDQYLAVGGVFLCHCKHLFVDVKSPDEPISTNPGSDMARHDAGPAGNGLSLTKSTVHGNCCDDSERILEMVRTIILNELLARLQQRICDGLFVHLSKDSLSWSPT